MDPRSEFKSWTSSERRITNQELILLSRLVSIGLDEVPRKVRKAINAFILSGEPQPYLTISHRSPSGIIASFQEVLKEELQIAFKTIRGKPKKRQQPFMPLENRLEFFTPESNLQIMEDMVKTASSLSCLN